MSTSNFLSQSDKSVNDLPITINDLKAAENSRWSETADICNLNFHWTKFKFKLI